MSKQPKIKCECGRQHEIKDVKPDGTIVVYPCKWCLREKEEEIRSDCLGDWPR